MSDHNETVSPNRSEEGSSSRCLALQRGEEVTYWYPKIKHLDIPMPQTEIPVTKNIIGWVIFARSKPPNWIDVVFIIPEDNSR